MYKFDVLGSVVAIFSVFLLIYAYFKRQFGYWSRRGVYQSKPSFPFGNVASVIFRRQNMGEKIKELYDEAKDLGEKFVGLYFFSRKVLLVVDPELINDVLTRSFSNFDDRGIHYDEVNDPLSAHLFSLSGPKWKALRAKFTPAFTPGKLKYMFESFSVCGDQMVQVLKKYAKHGEGVEIKDIMARFTTDVIGSCAFGLDCNSTKNLHSEFREMGKRAFTQTFGDVLRVTVIRSFPHIAKMLNLGIFPSSTTNFFKNVVEETIHYREKNNVVRQDFLQLLIQLRRDGQIDEEICQQMSSNISTSLTLDEAAAQAFIFFLAGFETTATTMCFSMFEMAVNENVQKNARFEINRVLEKYENKISYESISEMKYLDTVVFETLRKYPPAPVYLRKCTKPFNVPDTNVIIPEGFSVLIPSLAVQRDPNYFPKPEEFLPERFDENNNHNIKEHTYIPFGEGPRNCIGQRFALIQIKVGLALILSNFQFTLNRKTILPLKLETKGIILTPFEGVWLNLRKVN